MPEFFEWIGDFELTEFVEKAKEIVDESMKEELEETVERVVETAKDFAPDDTGIMRDAIEGHVSSGGMYGKVIVPAKTAYYAHFVEYGTRFMQANPFLHQALEEETANFTKNLSDRINEKAEE